MLRKKEGASERMSGLLRKTDNVKADVLQFNREWVRERERDNSSVKDTHHRENPI